MTRDENLFIVLQRNYPIYIYIYIYMGLKFIRPALLRSNALYHVTKFNWLIFIIIKFL